jgi:soluble lytic murein transglycosylase-like protein
LRLSALLLLFPLLAPAAPALPPELETFLGPKPTEFEQRFLAPARQLRTALDHLSAGKKSQAHQELSKLAKSGEMAEHASYELANLLREMKEFGRSNVEANQILYRFPATTYRELLEEIIAENDCDLGLAEAAKATGPITRGRASETLQRCLQRTPWRDWSEREAQAEALYGILKAGKDPLLGPFVAELIQAMPASAAIRSKIQKEIPAGELQQYANVARFRTKTATGTGIRPQQPDLELFEKGMLAVLENRWSAARALFQQVVEEYPQSEHLDRAEYWIARSEETLGNKDEANRRYELIRTASPLSYYGLQSALRLKRDLSLAIVPVAGQPEPLAGTPLPRQALHLWRLRALLETGLLDYARSEARALFQHRPGGFTFGQESPGGAALAGLLYHSAGFSLGAFSHAIAAISLEPEQLNAFTLELLFPHSFQREFEAAAEASGVHPLLLLSVAKQESAFLPNARSRANALGLMQLLLPTARDMDPKVSRRELFEPARNSAIGSRYLQRLLQRFQGNVALALAGYNAGPSRAVQWNRRFLEYSQMKESFDVDAFIDTIPFTETRRYVAAVLRNYAWYKLLNNDGKVESIEELAFQWQKNQKETEQPESPAAQLEPVSQ